ncbi:Crp/Fnr family transcriptional regulator [Solitalea lacus]|uniref:Crp/Fnr family transcriptional regulator n=1 Tax=Solitalea lacus TaxID=2911172 RepID=UPI001EDB93A8|nr:Crp/Fnr family transcriptional regulator [Solitalea lacus]UKJ08965.1 Crp/Fnr family transcriptional regulator [Solitalea lacus]
MQIKRFTSIFKQMPYESLKQKILSYSSFSDEELKLILSKFTSNTFKGKEFLLPQDKICTAIYFVTKGLVRTYYVRDGKEVTTYLACDDQFISAYTSFITQSASVEMMQAIEQTEVLSISYKNMQELYKAVPNWQIIGRLLAEYNYICIADRVLKLQGIPAKEKYANFLVTTPLKIVQRTPLIHIASYLGITPESLSRIRNGNS